MAKLDWSKAKKSRPGDQANPGKKKRRPKVLYADNWDDLERLVRDRGRVTLLKART